MKEQVEKEAEVFERKKKIAKAGGRLLGAAFTFISEMLPHEKESQKTIDLMGAFKTCLLDSPQHHPF